MSWQPGDIVVRRDVWRGQPKVAWGGIVVADTPGLLALYMPESSPLAFAPDFFGEPHPWSGKDRWEGHASSSSSGRERCTPSGSSGREPSGSTGRGT